jgi:hypothetical protein
MAEDAAALSQVMLAIQGLAKDVAKRHSFSKRSSQCFPHVCRNGADCKWFACGSCWLNHCKSDDVPQRLCNPEKLGDKAKETKALEVQIVKVQALIDKRLNEFSSHVDCRLADIEAQLQFDKVDGSNQRVSQANPEIDVKLDTLEVAMNSLSDPVQHSSQDIKHVSSEFETMMDNKLTIFMQERVKEAFEAASAAFAEQLDEAMRSVEQGVAQVEPKLRTGADVQICADGGET